MTGTIPEYCHPFDRLENRIDSLFLIAANKQIPRSAE
jgi:hypothetical protein